MAVRFTTGEYAFVFANACDAGYRAVAPYARKRLLSVAAPDFRCEAQLADESVRRLREKIRRVGVTLTQLVRHCHAHPDQDIPAELRSACEEVREYLQQVLRYDR